MRGIFITILNLLLAVFSYSQTLTPIELPDFGTVKHWHHNDTLSVVSTEAGNLYLRQRHSDEWIRVPETFHVIHGVSVSTTNIIVVGETPNNQSASGIMYTGDLGQTWNQLRPMTVFGSGVGYADFKSTLSQFFFTWGSGDVKRYNYSSSIVTTLTDVTTNIIGTYGLNIIGSNFYRYVNVNSTGFINFTTYSSSLLGSLQPMYYVPGQTNNITYSDGTYELIVDRNVNKIYTRGPGLPGPHSEFNYNVIGNPSNFDLICRDGFFYVKFKIGTITYLYYSMNGVNFNGTSFINTIPDFKPVEVLPNGQLLVKSSTLLVFNPQTQKFSPFDKGMKEAVVQDVSMNDYGDLILNCKNFTYTRLAGDTVYTSHLNSQDMATMNRVHVSNSRTFYAFGSGDIAKRKNLSDSDFSTINFPVASVKLAVSKQDSILACAEEGAYRSFNGGNQFQPPINLPLTPPYSSALFLASGVNSNNLLYRQFNSSGNAGFLRTHDFGHTWQLAVNLPITGYEQSTMFAINDSVVFYSEFIPNSLQEDVVEIDNNGTQTIINTLARPANEAIRHKGIWVENNDLYVSEVIHSQNAYHLVVKKADDLIQPFTPLHQVTVNNTIDSANSVSYVDYFTVKVCGRHKFFSGLTNALYRLSTDIDSSFLLVTGKVYFDFNNNNLFDSLDVPANGMLINSTTGVNTTTNATGNYQCSVTATNTILTITPPVGYSSSPTQQLVNPGTTNMNFALQANSGVNDLSVTHQYSANFVNQVFFFPVTITCKNEGTNAVSGVLKFIVNGNHPYGLYNYSQFPDMASGDTVFWNLPVMQPQQVLTYQLWIDLPMNLASGTPFDFVSEVVPNSVIDINYSNNHFATAYFYGVLQDHTYKLANPTLYSLQQMQDNDDIYYTIFFRNYGPGAAFRIEIIDTLSALLNMASFAFVSSSHPNFVTQIQNNVLKVTYPSINLPDSTSASIVNDYTGFYQFKIKPLPGWNAADTIHNKAEIVFDYSTYTSSDTVSTYQTLITSVAPKNIDSFTLYPNPAKGFIIVEGLKINESLSLYDATGQTVASFSIDKPQQIIFLPNLEPGLYFARSAFGIKKLIIQ